MNVKIRVILHKGQTITKYIDCWHRLIFTIRDIIFTEEHANIKSIIIQRTNNRKV